MAIQGVPGSGTDQDPVQRRVQRKLDGRLILFDGEGFFMHLEDWSPTVADILAKESGLSQLAEAHWLIINFLRDYYHENNRVPLNVQLKNGTGISLLQLEALFPGGIKLGARRIAGLPNPKSCM